MRVRFFNFTGWDFFNWQPFESLFMIYVLNYGSFLKLVVLPLQSKWLRNLTQMLVLFSKSLLIGLSKKTLNLSFFLYFSLLEMTNKLGLFFMIGYIFDSGELRRNKSVRIWQSYSSLVDQWLLDYCSICRISALNVEVSNRHYLLFSFVYK